MIKSEWVREWEIKINFHIIFFKKPVISTKVIVWQNLPTYAASLSLNGWWFWWCVFKNVLFHLFCLPFFIILLFIPYITFVVCVAQNEKKKTLWDKNEKERRQLLGTNRQASKQRRFYCFLRHTSTLSITILFRSKA